MTATCLSFLLKTMEIVTPPQTLCERDRPVQPPFGIVKCTWMCVRPSRNPHINESQSPFCPCLGLSVSLLLREAREYRSVLERCRGFTEITACASTPTAAPPARDSFWISSARDAKIKKTQKIISFVPGGSSRLGVSKELSH